MAENKQEKTSRQALDSFSANVLINLALINVAGLAAILSQDSALNSAVPFAVGLMSSIFSQLLWYATSAFDYVFGDAQCPMNEKIGSLIAVLIIAFGCLSATGIIYGCLAFLGLNSFLSLILSILITFFPLFLLIYTGKLEVKYREASKS